MANIFISMGSKAVGNAKLLMAEIFFKFFVFHVKLLINSHGEFVSRETFEVRIGSFFMSHANFLRSASKPATLERVADEKPFFCFTWNICQVALCKLSN